MSRLITLISGVSPRQRASGGTEPNTPYTPGDFTPARDSTPRSLTPRTTPQIDPSKILPQLRQAFPGGVLKDTQMYNNLAAAVAQQSPQTSRAQYPPQFGYTQQFSQPYQQPTYSR